MTDILDRLKERCWPHEKRDELCMDAADVITDLRARLAGLQMELTHQSNAKAGQQRRAEIAETQLNEAKKLLKDAVTKELVWDYVADRIDAFLGTTQGASADGR